MNGVITSFFFKPSEFECKCGCGLNNIDPHLVYLLDTLRKIISAPIIITSGCRCKEHNKLVGGKNNSAHLKGLAVDIRVASDKYRYQLIRIALTMEFNRIGISKKFIHLDIDETKTQDVVWLY